MLSTNILIVVLLALALMACKPAAPHVLVIEDAAPLSSAPEPVEPEIRTYDTDDLLH